jgi:hypothetical protein
VSKNNVRAHSKISDLLLRQGWQIVKETNNGKEVIVRKQ